MEAQLFANMGDRNIGVKIVEAPLFVSMGDPNMYVSPAEDWVYVHTENKNLNASSVEEARFASMKRGKIFAIHVVVSFFAKIAIILLSIKKEIFVLLAYQGPVYGQDAMRSGLLEH